MKKRILYLENSISNLGIGGSHRSLHTLIDGVDRSKYEPYLLLNQQNKFLIIFESLNIPIFYLSHKVWGTATGNVKKNNDQQLRKKEQKRNSIKRFMWDLNRIIRNTIPMTLKTIVITYKFKIDLIHTNTRIGSNQHGILAGWLTNTPVVTHERWWSPDNWLNRFLVKIPKIIICVSEAIKNNVLNIGGNKQKCKVIFNGRKLPVQIDSIKKYDDTFKDKFIIGFMSTISEYKGHTIFVKGAIELLKKYPKMEFHIYGDTETTDQHYLQLLKELIDKAGFTDSITFNGYIRYVNKLIQGFHINCCLTVGNEPLSGTIIEGFFNQTVVVATNTGGSSELITHEENGWLIEPDSVEAFMNAVENLYCNPALMKRLANNGFEYAKKNLSNEKYVNNVVTIYEQILSEQ